MKIDMSRVRSITRFLLGIAAGLFLIGAGSVAKADDMAYMVTGGGSFGTIDLTTGVYTQLGLTQRILQGLAFKGTTLYGAGAGDNNQDGQLWLVNPANGLLIAVGQPTGIQYQAFGSLNNTLYAIDHTSANPILYSIDSSTGAATMIGHLNIGPLAGFYSLSNNSTALYFQLNSGLYTLNTTTGQASPAGALGGNLQAGAMVEVGGKLYAAQDNTSVAPLEILTLDKTTGAATVVSNVSGANVSYIYGLAPLSSSPSATAFSQKISKSLAFAQMAVGGASPVIWETIVNLTNRGTTTYTGSFNLYTMANGNPQPWNPVVNGNASAVTNGQMTISINPGDTTTLTFTGGNNTVSGFGRITPTNSSSTDETSFVEGTLTYYVKNGTDIEDNIGILPSDPIYLTTIPFDTFDNITLALANTNATTASVKLKLYSASGQMVGTQTQTLQTNVQLAEYLWQVFTDVTMTAGRLDIESDTPIYGVALTGVGSQFSSLPFLPAAKSFNWTINFGSSVMTGTVSMRFYESQGEFQSTILTRNGSPIANPSTRYVVGTFNGGNFSAYDFDQTDNEIQYWSFSSLSFSTKTVSGIVQIWTLNNPTITYQGQGTITLTATN